MLLRVRDFRLILASTGLSALGDELALIALTIKVFELTGSGFAVSGLLLAGLVPLVLLAPFAGLLVDRRETVRILSVATLVQAGLATALAFVDSLPAILALTFLLGIGFAVGQPALFTLVPKVVGEENTTEANGYLETARYAGAMAGPILAGGLAAGLGTRTALLADAGTFLGVAAAAAALRVRRHPATRKSRDRRGEARAGLAFLARDRLLLLAVVVIAAMVLFAAIDNVAEIFFARDPELLDAGNWGYGALATLWIVGMVVGATLIAGRLRAFNLVPSVLVAAVGGGVAVAFAALLPNIWIALVAFFLGGIANGVENVSMRSLIHHRVPDELRGRVFAAYSGLVTATQIGATALGGVLVGVIEAQLSLLVAGLGSAAVGLIGMIWYSALASEVRIRRPEPWVSV